MTDRTPTTEIGKRLSDDIAQLADSADASVWDDGSDLYEHFDGLIVKAEDEARAPLVAALEAANALIARLGPPRAISNDPHDPFAVAYFAWINANAALSRENQHG